MPWLMSGSPSTQPQHGSPQAHKSASDGGTACSTDFLLRGLSCMRWSTHPQLGLRPMRSTEIVRTALRRL
jgi:hypothetical protein